MNGRLSRFQVVPSCLGRGSRDPPPRDGRLGLSRDGPIQESKRTSPSLASWSLHLLLSRFGSVSLSPSSSPETASEHSVAKMENPKPKATYFGRHDSYGLSHTNRVSLSNLNLLTPESHVFPCCFTHHPQHSEEKRKDQEDPWIQRLQERKDAHSISAEDENWNMRTSTRTASIL